MLKFYFNGAPNPNKIALFLEESGLPFEPVPVDTRKGDQFKPEFLQVNPNGKVPAIDDDGVFVFDSNAILLYLAEKTGQFLPANTPSNRAQMLSWLMFIATGLGPYSGQAVHFKHFAPKDLDYARERYEFEANRHYKILDDHLAKSRYMVGDTYAIVDMALWGWARMAPSCSAKRPPPSSARSTGWSTKSRHGPPPPRQSRRRTSSPSRPRWTTKRAASCLGT
jgi:GSH-dependent disulfide-bond oxidoreductase